MWRLRRRTRRRGSAATLTAASSSRRWLKRQWRVVRGARTMEGTGELGENGKKVEEGAGVLYIGARGRDVAGIGGEWPAKLGGGERTLAGFDKSNPGYFSARAHGGSGAAVAGRAGGSDERWATCAGRVGKVGTAVAGTGAGGRRWETVPTGEPHLSATRRGEGRKAAAGWASASGRPS